MQTRKSFKLRTTLSSKLEQIVPIDYDSDGDSDLIALVGDAMHRGYLIVLQNDGKGGLTQTQTISTPWEFRRGKYPIHPSGLVVDDLDQDGDPDLIIGGLRDRRRSNIAVWTVTNSSAQQRGPKRLVDGSVGSHGAKATLSFGRDPSLGNRHFAVRLGRVPFGREAALLLSWRPIRMQRVGLNLIAGPWRSFGTRTRGNAETGWAELVFDIPNDTQLLDFTFRFQWLYRDAKAPNPIGVSSSSGWSLQLQR